MLSDCSLLRKLVLYFINLLVFQFLSFIFTIQLFAKFILTHASGIDIVRYRPTISDYGISLK